MLTVDHNEKSVNVGVFTDQHPQYRFPRRPANLPELTELFSVSLSDKSFADVAKAMNALHHFVLEYVAIQPKDDFIARKASLELLPSYEDIIAEVKNGNTVKQAVKNLMRKVWNDFQPSTTSKLD